MHTLKLKIPPPIVALIFGALMWLVARAAPMFAFALPGRGIIATCIVLTGFTTAVMGAASFRRAGTTVNPLHPEKASSLVISGVYKVTRNPMYLGLLLVLVAWGIFLSNVLALILLPVFVLYMNYFQIRPEEIALTSVFGQQFVAYKSRVRRWL